MLSNPRRSTVVDGEKEKEDGELSKIGGDEGQDEKEGEGGEVGQGKEDGGDGDEDPSKFHNWKGRGAAQMILPLVVRHSKVRSFKEELKTIFKLSPDEKLGGSSCQLQELAQGAGDEAGGVGGGRIVPFSH